MTSARQLPLQSASKTDSIWRKVQEDDFRRQMIELEDASGEVPSDPKVHSLQEWHQAYCQRNNRKHSLPIHVEQRLADDFAFVAAAKEDPKAVSAATIEERLNGSGLLIYLSANDGVLSVVSNTLGTMLGVLSKCARRALPRAECAASLFDCVLQLCDDRIHGRLESLYWTPPKHQPGRKKQPLHQALKKLSSSLKSARSTSPRSIKDLRRDLNLLSDDYQAVDRYSGDSAKRAEAVKVAVRKSYAICTSNGTCSLESTILAYGLDPKQVCKERVIRQIHKIGRYWGLCLDMAEDSRRYKGLFQQSKLECIAPYTGNKSKIFAKQNRKGFVKCHVHAEIQMLVYWDQKSTVNTLKPRVIGVNKSACYLCNLFFQCRKEYFLTKTHGHLYDQWTLPDSASFGPQQRDEYRRIIKAMMVEMKAAVRRQPMKHRIVPTGSWISLPTPPNVSPLASDAGTLISENPMEGQRPMTAKSIPEISTSPLIPVSATLQSNLSWGSPVPISPSQLPGESTFSTVTADCQQSATSSTPYRTISSAKMTSSTNASLTPNPESPLPYPSPPATPTIEKEDPFNQVHALPPEACGEENLAYLPHCLSASTILLNEQNFPLNRKITALKPARLSSPGIQAVFEVEGHTTAEITCTYTRASEQEGTVNVINLDALGSGQAVELTRDEDSLYLAVSLRAGDSGADENAIKYELRWLS